MTWTTAEADLRNLLSDGPKDHFVYRKRVVGLINGTNTVFKTFEFRRTTDFTTAVAPLGVYVDGAPITVIADNLEFGEFTLTTAPLDGSVVEASYNFQWFLNAELDIFLKNSTQWLGYGFDVTTVPDGLQPAGLYYASQEAYHKIAVRWAERMSDAYRFEDAFKAEAKAAIESYMKLSEEAKKKSESLRAGFYTRQDQPLAPNFGVNRGAIRAVIPRR